MLRHQWLAWITMVLLLPALQAQQPPQTPQPPPLTAQDKARALEMCQSRWDKAIQDMTSFQADVDRVTMDPQFGSKEMLSGVVKFMQPNFFFLDLKHKDKPDTYDRVLSTGNFLYQWVPQSKLINAIPMPKSEGSGDNSINPLIACLKGTEARKRFDLEYVNEDANYHYILVRPKTAADKGEFTWARLVLNKDTSLPREIRWMTPDKNEVLWNVRSFQVNAQLNRDEFVAPKVPQGWKMEQPPQKVRSSDK
jgi:TIGR03009 family protein